MEQKKKPIPTIFILILILTFYARIVHFPANNPTSSIPCSLGECEENKSDKSEKEDNPSPDKPAKKEQNKPTTKVPFLASY